MWNVHGLLGSNGSSCLSMLVAGVGTVLGRRPPDAFDNKKALFLSPKAISFLRGIRHTSVTSAFHDLR